MSINRDNVESIRKISDISIPSSQMLLGDVSLTNQVITNGFGTTLYTGNGSTQTITTDVPMSGQWGNDASESYGGLVWLKSRSVALTNRLYDTVRGINKVIGTDTTSSEQTAGGTGGVTSFLPSSFTLGNAPSDNTNLATYASWNFGTTHIRTGTTNHGKAYTEHYNPFTGFTIIKFEGSGTAGHEIPHSLGRKLGFVTTKNLSVVAGWNAQYRESNSLQLELTNAEVSSVNSYTVINETKVVSGVSVLTNTSTNQYIMYGWANSYYDEGQLQGNYEIGTYTGTGVAGNKVTTRGKPAWLIIKRLDSVGEWIIQDNLRANGYLLANSSGAEGTFNWSDNLADGFTIPTTDALVNASGGQYLYMVAYDNDSGSGKSKYYRTTTTSNLSIANRVMQFSKGVIDGSFKNSSETAISETPVPTNGYVDGYQYLYKVEGGSWYSTVNEPTYSGTSYNGFGDYFDAKSGKWYRNVAVFTDDFSDGDVSDWTTITAGTINAVGKKLFIQHSGTDYPKVEKTITGLIPSKKYRLTITLNSSDKIPATALFGVMSFNTTSFLGGVGGTFSAIGFTLSGSITFSFLCQTTTLGVWVTADNISIVPINEDGTIDTSSATEVSPTITYLPKKVLVASGDIVTVDDFKYPSLVQKYVKADKVECTEFKHNGIDVGGFIGVGQTWQNVTASRVLGTTYTNSTGRPLMVTITATNLNTNSWAFAIDGANTAYASGTGNSATANKTLCLVVPNGSTYSANITSGSCALTKWNELR